MELFSFDLKRKECNMNRNFKNFIVQFHDKAFATLFVESLLFSALLGVGFRSWEVGGLIFLGLSCLLNRWWNGKVYAVIALSFIWGFVAASIGYSFGGWVWSSILGVFVFIKGVQIHLRKLKLSWGVVNFIEYNNTIESRHSWIFGGQNLN